MRWSNLRIDADERARLPGYRDEAVVRHFDAPEAIATRFYEVRAKSILNRVPEASQMPFRWTINPYRGCSHACAYCLAGETQVLTAEGAHKPIADLKIGDAIYGTTRAGQHRRYVRTTVRDTWITTKSSYRVRLHDGTELIASGDHRFLTERGWRHVRPSAEGVPQRPHLTTEDRLMGIVAYAQLAAVGEREAVPIGGPSPLRVDAERSIEGQMVRTSAEMRVAEIEPLGRAMALYDLTTGTGDFIANGVVSHNCFARPTHKYLDFDAGRDFEREIVVKINAPELLRIELARPSWTGEHIALGTNTDPYQWVEGRYKLMTGIWEAMRDAANPCSILTKSPLLLRDLPVMKQIAERTEFSAAVSVPTLDERAWRATEPHTPNPRARLEAVAELTRAGIRTGVLVAPLMPGINDQPEQIAKILELASEAGASYVTGIALHLRGDVKGLFFEWLEEHRPDLLPRYKRLYKRGAYAPSEERQRLARLVKGPDLEPSERMRGRTERAVVVAERPVRRPAQERLF